MKNGIAYALHVPMDHVARVKVVKTFRHVPQQVDAIYIRLLSHVVSDPGIFHPFTNDLERWWCIGRNSEERNDVGVL